MKACSLTHESVQFGSVAQSCPTLCKPMDCTMPGFPVHHQLPSLLKYMSIKSVMLSNHFILCHPLFLPPSNFPSIRVYSNELFPYIRWPKYWSFSPASVLPMNIQDWFPLEWTGWISLLSKGLSRVFNINSSTLSFLYSPTLTSIHDYWKNHSFDLTDLSWQSNVSAFQYAV